MDINIYCTKENDEVLYNYIISDMKTVINKVENLTLDNLLAEVCSDLRSTLKQCKYGYNLLGNKIEL